MKKTLLGTLMLIAASQSVFGGQHYYYYHNPSQDMIDPYNFNEETKTAVYYDYRDSKKKTANFSDMSRETREAVNGVKQGNHVLLDMPGHKFCEVFHVFENGLAYIGCQTEAIRKNIGMDRPKDLRYFARTDAVIAEVKELDGFAKKEKVILSKDAGKIQAGTTVRIEALFVNGEALVQKMGANLLDTSSLRLKFNIEKVSIRDLEKKQ